MVALTTGAVTTAVCGPLLRRGSSAPPPSFAATAVWADSIPQPARISGAPGKNFTHAAAAAARTTSARSNCFQAAIDTPVRSNALTSATVMLDKVQGGEDPARLSPWESLPAPYDNF